MPTFWMIIIILVIIAAVVNFFPFIIIAGAIALIILIILSKLNKKMRKEYNIPDKAIKIHYYGGYNKKLNKKIYCWTNSSQILFSDPKTRINIRISRDDILSFTTLGEYSVSQKISGGKVSGGGVSIGGAIIGGIIAGPVGAIIAGRKKIKSEPIRTENIVKDTRSVVLRFNEYNANKKMILDYKLYKKLLILCPSKNQDI